MKTLLRFKDGVQLSRLGLQYVETCFDKAILKNIFAYSNTFLIQNLT